jgi:hypothetical protein
MNLHSVFYNGFLSFHVTSNLPRLRPTPNLPGSRAYTADWHLSEDSDGLRCTILPTKLLHKIVNFISVSTTISIQEIQISLGRRGRCINCFLHHWNERPHSTLPSDPSSYTRETIYQATSMHQPYIHAAMDMLIECSLGFDYSNPAATQCLAPQHHGSTQASANLPVPFRKSHFFYSYGSPPFTFWNVPDCNTFL